jgi:cold shock CspA family protein
VTSGPAAVWRAADDDLWVGTVGGEYAGLIVRHPDGFHAHDRWTRPVGIASTFDRATCLLAPARTSSSRARRTSTLHRLRPSGRGNRRRTSAPAERTREDIMATGTVKWFNAEKGFGFIAPSDGSADVFAHFSAIVSTGGFRTLEENQQVEFEVTQGPKGLQASDIRPL